MKAAGSDTSDLLQIAVERPGEDARVTTSGAIDMATTHRLATVLDKLTNEGVRRITVDLHDVTILDSRCRPRTRLDPRRGSGWQASRWRARVLAQTGGRCARCGTWEGVQAHHLEPLRFGGDPRGAGRATLLPLPPHGREGVGSRLRV
jgi:hypothetical protein